MENVKEIVRTFLLNNFLPGDPPDVLLNDADLQEQGVLDSLGTLELVSFLEERFRLSFLPEELDSSRLSSVNEIEGLVKAKLETRA